MEGAPHQGSTARPRHAAHARVNEEPAGCCGGSAAAPRHAHEEPRTRGVAATRTRPAEGHAGPIWVPLHVHRYSVVPVSLYDSPKFFFKFFTMLPSADPVKLYDTLYDVPRGTLGRPSVEPCILAAVRGVTPKGQDRYLTQNGGNPTPPRLEAHAKPGRG